MGSKCIRGFEADDVRDLEYAIDRWCDEYGYEPVSVSVTDYGFKLVALVVMEEKDDVI